MSVTEADLMKMLGSTMECVVERNHYRTALGIIAEATGDEMTADVLRSIARQARAAYDKDGTSA